MPTNATSPIVRWGILGTANIARKIWKAIHLTSNSTVKAVASRQLQKSKDFVAECNGQVQMDSPVESFGSYEELIRCKEVDAVYIPLPTGLRKEWVLRAAEAGKHVLSEKPCACTMQDMEEMLAACRQNKVQFMDNVMFVHSARLPRLHQALEDKARFGTLRRLDSAFSFPGDEGFFKTNIRMQPGMEPHGCVGDLGWYCLRLCLWALNWKLPVEASGRLLATGDGDIPIEFSGELVFGNGVSAGFYCSFVTGLQQWAIFSGTSGTAEISDFVLPFAGDAMAFETRTADFQKNVCDFRMGTDARTINVKEASHGKPDAQEVNCVRNFADQIRSGCLNESWPDQALKTQKVMCACLESARAGGRIVRL